MKGYRKLGGRAENSVGWYRKRFTPELVKGIGIRWSLRVSSVMHRYG